MQPFQRYKHHNVFANFFCCQDLVGELSAAVSQKPFTNKIYCKRQKLFFSLGQIFGEKKFQNFSPLGGGWVVGCHSSPPIFFHKKLRNVGLFLRTFFRIKSFAAIPEILATQVFCKLFLVSGSCRRTVGELSVSYQ